MKIRALFSLFVAFSVSSICGGEQTNPLGLYQQQTAATSSNCSVRGRAKHFSPLGALPADTDSFVVFSRLGELSTLLQRRTGILPAVELLAELDGLAIGMSERTVSDLKRLQPLLQVASSGVSVAAEEWKIKAEDDVARAIVAEQRAQFDSDAEILVQAARDFHLAPIYFVLTAKEDGQQFLQQLSLLPMMLPIASDAPVEITARGDWRGFCVHGNRLDLTMLGLSPEQESELKKSLEHARLYVAARKVGKRLVLVICSNLEEVAIPAKYTQSLLASPVMKYFDSSVQQNPWAVGYSSAAVVKMREELDVFDYLNTIDFMERVFRRLGAGSETYSTAAEALKTLRSLSMQLMPEHHGPERFVVWGEDEVFLHMTGAAGNIRFAPGSIRYADRAVLDKTAVYVESTALEGLPEVDVPAVLDDIEKVQSAFRSSLKSDYAADGVAMAQRLERYRPYIEAFAAMGDVLNCSVQGSSAFLFSVEEGNSPSAGTLSLCAGVADPQITSGRLKTLLPALSGCGFAPSVGTREGECVLSCGGNPPVPAEDGVPVSGAAFYAVNLSLLNKVVQLEGLQAASSLINRIDGAMYTQESEFHFLLRLTPQKQN